MEQKISFVLNGKKTSVLTDPSQTLLWVLRNDLGLTGTKYGCGSGYCGACTVLIDNEAVRSCTLSAGEVAGKKVVTIEGLEKKGVLHPLQKAFIDNDALQCGFCTPGMIMNALALIMRSPRPSRQELIDGMADNLCRCGTQERIIEAIQTASTQMKGGR